jgi:hypothetical protein
VTAPGCAEITGNSAVLTGKDNPFVYKGLRSAKQNRPWLRAAHQHAILEKPGNKKPPPFPMRGLEPNIIIKLNYKLPSIE